MKSLKLNKYFLCILFMNFVAYLLGKINQVVFCNVYDSNASDDEIDSKQKSSSLPEFVMFMFVFVSMFK